MGPVRQGGVGPFEVGCQKIRVEQVPFGVQNGFPMKPGLNSRWKLSHFKSQLRFFGFCAMIRGISVSITLRIGVREKNGVCVTS